LNAAADDAQCSTATDRVCAVFDSAADSWEKGSPVEPVCEDVVRDVFAALAEYRLIHA